MDAFLDETDDVGRMVSYGRVACVAVVGNEDGAHHVTAELYQAVADVGFTIPANAVSYWVGKAMGEIDYKDLKPTPRVVKTATDMLVSNTRKIARRASLLSLSLEVTMLMPRGAQCESASRRL